MSTRAHRARRDRRQGLGVHYGLAAAAAPHPVVRTTPPAAPTAGAAPKRAGSLNSPRPGHAEHVDEHDANPSSGLLEPGQVEVLRGEHGPLRWRVLVSGDQDELLTVIQVHHGARRVVAGSGFAGPALRPGQVLSEWRGRTDDLPYFVMTRSDPVVDRVLAITNAGTEVELAMSPVVAPFGLRFAAAGLPEGEEPHQIRAEHDGHTIVDQHSRVPPPRSPQRPT